MQSDPAEDWRREELVSVAEAAMLLGWDKQRVLGWLKRTTGSRLLEGGEVASPPTRDRWKVTRRSIDTLAVERPDLLGTGAIWMQSNGTAPQFPSAITTSEPYDAAAEAVSGWTAEERIRSLEQDIALVRKERDELRNRVANLEQSALRLNDALVASHAESGERLRAQSDALRIWLVRDNPVQGTATLSKGSGT